MTISPEYQALIDGMKGVRVGYLPTNRDLPETEQLREDVLDLQACVVELLHRLQQLEETD